MNDAKVMQLFQTFASLADVEMWRDIAEAEMNAVYAELRPDADPADSRLCFYAAARAFLQYRRIVAAGQASPSYAGTTAGGSADQGGCGLAEELVRVYRSHCASLLRDDAFVFLHTEGCA